MTLARRRTDLAPLISRTVLRLQDEGLRAYAGEMAARGWRSRLDPALVARRFWTIAIGVTVEGQAVGRSPDGLVADMMALLELAPEPAMPVSLRTVGGGDKDPAGQFGENPP
jgi:hypothetical protein